MAAFNYTSRDFDTIRADMLARATEVMPEWTERDPSDFGMLLVDLWAHAADIMHYYIDRAAGETSITTATQRESLLAIANLMDYTPRGRSSAVSTLTLTNSTAASVLVPQFTTLIAQYNNKSYQCYTTSNVTIAAGNNAAVTISEGTRHVEEVLASSSDGTVGQRYSLTTTNVDPYSIYVYVLEDGLTATQYRRVTRIIDAPTGDRVFAVYSAADGSTQVIFGTYLNGFVPPTGAKIKATYTESSGADGNIPANCITAFSGTTPTGISITSSTSFTGGTDNESITSMKRSIPAISGTNNRAVTRADFIALASQVPGVAKASLSFVQGGASSNSSVTIYPQIYRSDYLTTTASAETVSTATSLAVINTLQPLALLGVSVLSASAVAWTYIDLGITLVVQDRFVRADVQTAVSTALDELFSFDNVFFGQRIHLGQVYRIINNVTGVDYAIITKFDANPGTAVQSYILIDVLKLPKKGSYTFSTSGGTV